MKKPCVICKKNMEIGYLGFHSKTKTCSYECRLIVQRRRARRHVKCSECHVPIIKIHKNHKNCSSCSSQKAKDNNLTRMRKIRKENPTNKFPTTEDTLLNAFNKEYTKYSRKYGVFSPSLLYQQVKKQVCNK